MINIGNIEIEVTRKDIKNMHLSVHPPDGHVKISAPISIEDKEIKAFALSKLRWIKNKIEMFKSSYHIQEIYYVSGENHYYMGKPYILNIIDQKGRTKASIRDDTYINLYVKPKSLLKDREKALKIWYRTELKNIVEPIINKLEPTLDVTVKQWGIKQMKTRWGSCNTSAKRIWLNLELVKKPIYCIQYVVLHEMVHLIHRLHDDKFKRCMDSFMPNWRVCKKELNQSIAFPKQNN